jgi:hypothetical protein
VRVCEKHQTQNAFLVPRQEANIAFLYFFFKIFDSLTFSSSIFFFHACAVFLLPFRTVQSHLFCTVESRSAPDRVLVLIFGDHGMTADGNHGGATVDETQSALLVYSTAPLGVRVVNAHDDDDDGDVDEIESEINDDDGKGSKSGAGEEQAARSRHAGGSAEVADDDGSSGATHPADDRSRNTGESMKLVRDDMHYDIDGSHSVDGGDGEWLVSERVLNAYASVPIADDQWFQRQIAAAQRTANAVAARRPNRMPSPSAASSANANVDAVAAASALASTLNTSSSSSLSSASSLSSSSSSSSSSFSSSSSSLPAHDVAADIRAAHAKAARYRALFERDERRRVRMVDQVRQ